MTHEERRKRREDIRRSAMSGKALSEISAEFGLDYDYVKKVCRGIKTRHETHPKAATSFEILADLLNTSQSLSEVARKFQVSRQRVHQIYKEACKAGIKVPQRNS